MKTTLMRCLCRAALLIAVLAASLARAEIIVNYPSAESKVDARGLYPTHLLELALARSGKPYRVVLSRVRMQQSRALILLEKGDGIDAVCFMTSAEREERLLPIRIPVDKGLIGSRLLLVNKAHLGKFSKLATVDDLRPLRAGQGINWPDMPILQANGLEVFGTTSYDSLFQMLEAERIDYFPRASTEIWNEAERHPRLAVVPGIMLHYTAAAYFFVRKDNPQLATDIAEGLEKMIADGSFEQLFQKYHGDVIARSDLKGRRVIELHNPLQPQHMPLDRKVLWYR